MPPFLLALLANPLARKVALYVAIALAALTVYKVHVHSLEAKAAQVAALTSEVAMRDTIIKRDSIARVALVERADSLDVKAKASQDSFHVVNALLTQRLVKYNARRPVDVTDTAAVKVAFADDSVTIGTCSLVVRTCEQAQADLRLTIHAKELIIAQDSVEKSDIQAQNAALKRATSIAPAPPKGWWDRQPAYVRYGLTAVVGAAVGHEVEKRIH
jgi:hypothetical protein